MKKSLYLIVALPMIFILAACSSLKLPGAAQPAASASQTTQRGQGGFANFSTQPVENKLAIGTLKLEGTPNAVTQKEATDLLPLWKAVKSLATSNTTSADEVQALYKQIEDTMTPAQVTAIKNLSMQQADMQALMQQYGIQANQGGGFGNLTPSEQATRIAQFRAQGGNGGGAGGTGNGNRTGGFGTGGGGFGGGNNGGTNANGQPSVQRTPNPARRNLGGLNYIFVDPVIKLLTQRAG